MERPDAAAASAANTGECEAKSALSPKYLEPAVILSSAASRGDCESDEIFSIRHFYEGKNVKANLHPATEREEEEEERGGGAGRNSNIQDEL